MQRFSRLFAAYAALLAGILIPAAAPADNGLRIVTGVFCDTQDQIEGFAEAHLGAQLSVLEATETVNKAAGRDDACSPIANVVVARMEEVKATTIGGKSYIITRLSVIGIMTSTPAGMAPRFVPALEQFVVAKTKGEEI
jgi:hypothetical protein